MPRLANTHARAKFYDFVVLREYPFSCVSAFFFLRLVGWLTACVYVIRIYRASHSHLFGALLSHHFTPRVYVSVYSILYIYHIYTIYIYI